MQQIQDIEQHKKASGLERFSICNNVLVRVQGLKPWASSLARKRSIN